MEKIKYSVLIIVSFVSLSFFGCGDKPVTGKIYVDETDLSYKEGRRTLTIETRGDWRLRMEYFGEEPETRNWCNADKESGTGNAEVMLSWEENGLIDRTVVITVSFESGFEIFELTQRGGEDPVDPYYDPSEPKEPENLPKWLELPEFTSTNKIKYVLHTTDLNGEQVRNYSMLYDKSTYTSYWVAYPLHVSYTGSFPRGNWRYDPNIGRQFQANLPKGSYANSDTYQRGHQIPSADRNATRAMNDQTFYSTNSTPQHGGLNGSKWGRVEDLLRAEMKKGNDTIYVTTGAVLNVDGESTPLQYTTDKDGVIQIPIPKYYYKVALKPKGSSYTCVGFWFENQPASGAVTRDDIYTVRQIEEMTGIDFFANLPRDIQDVIETDENYGDWGF